jgi:Stress responsive A/B Barrel Domain
VLTQTPHQLLAARLRSDLTQADREGLVQALEVALRDIPSIRNFRIGRRVTFCAGYERSAPLLDLCALIQFDDFSGLKAYLAHFAHRMSVDASRRQSSRRWCMTTS